MEHVTPQPTIQIHLIQQIEKCLITQTHSRLQPQMNLRTQTAHRITHLAIEMANPITFMPGLP